MTFIEEHAEALRRLGATPEQAVALTMQFLEIEAGLTAIIGDACGHLDGHGQPCVRPIGHEDDHWTNAQ